MKGKLEKFIKRFGWFGFVRLLFYPLTAFLTTPVRLGQTLWNCRILGDERWGNYNHFTPYSGINHLVYWTLALNLHKFGRSGKSPYLGLGNFPLSRFFYYSLFSLCSFWRASTVTILTGMFGWLLAHLVWISQINISWVLIVVTLALFSTTFYANSFALQNYSVLGWIFFPLGLYGILTENWILAGIAWICASFGSFTVIFIASILSIVVSISGWTYAPILAILPAGIKLLINSYHFFIHGNVKSSLLSILKAIGMVGGNTKYKMLTSKKIGISELYFLGIYMQFLIISYFITRNISILFVTGFLLFLINSASLRFADIQSMQMMMFSLATILIIQNSNPLLLLSYWILISPLPLFAGFPYIRNVFDVVPKLAPFNIKRLIDDMEHFLEPVKSGQRVFMTFNNPEGIYEKIFDGYRFLLELPLYVSSKKGIHFMPDWWSVFELNYKGAPDFWGRDIDSVKKNIKYCKADYVVIYQNTGTELDPKWKEAEFEVLRKFSWSDNREELKGMEPYDGKAPDWWLLKKPLKEII